MPPSPLAIERAGPMAVRPPEPERLIQVVTIKPPGAIPSGGSAGASEGRPSAAPAATRSVGAPVSPSVNRVVAAPAMQLVLASAPSSPLALPTVDATEDDETPRPARPNRGIIQRGSGAGIKTGTGGLGSSGTIGTGRGGRGGSGVTIVGRGTDCITAGLAAPGGLIPLTLPNNPGRRPGPGSGRGIGGGRIGQPRR